MAEKFVSVLGDGVDATQLRLPRATGYHRAVLESPFATLVECSARDGEGVYCETVVADLSLERPQRAVHDIRHVERIAARFSEADTGAPEALALRASFPCVTHLNLCSVEIPKSLCLYDANWDEQKLRWHANAFLERIREWLRLTARGELHQDDQPLEPLMLSSGYRLVLPHSGDSGDADTAAPIDMTLHGEPPFEQVLVASKTSTDSESIPAGGYLMIRIGTPAVTHGVIGRIPANLKELAAFTDRDGFSLVAALRERLKALPNDTARQRRFVLLLDLPKKRHPDGPVETTEHKAFLTFETVTAIGGKLEVWSAHEGVAGLIIGEPPDNDGEQVVLNAVMNVTETCDWEQLAWMNGDSGRTLLKIAAVGAGALGSQVLCNLARAGYGEWTVIDEDTMLPHNAARHAATGVYDGMGKAFIASCHMNAVAPQAPEIAQPLRADVLRPGEREPALDEVLQNADLVIDMSASVAVARKLAGQAGVKRVLSIFLNPSGEDLVTLVEDETRSIPLNHLEMTYYWALASNPELAGHLHSVDSTDTDTSLRVRYGASCRDVSARIPQDFVAIHAANGARAIRRIAVSRDASIAVYRYRADEGELHRVDVPVVTWMKCSVGEWEIRIVPAVLQEILSTRKHALPNETGGVLVGGVDFERSVIYVAGLIPAPADSKQFPNGFVRGSKQLAERLGTIERKTLGNLGYLGEWHSHPNGAGTMPSEADGKLLGWIQENTVPDGRPAVMIIGGQRRECRIVVGDVSGHKTVRCPKS